MSFPPPADPHPRSPPLYPASHPPAHGSEVVPGPPPGHSYGGEGPVYPGPQGGSGYPPSPAPAPPARRGRRGAILVIVASVAIVLAVLLLNFAGVINLGFLPHPGGPAESSPPALTLLQAEAIANQTAASRGEGSWGLAFATTLQGSGAYAPPTPPPPCSDFGYSPSASSLVGTGEAYSWGFMYTTVPYNTNSGPWPHALFIVVSNGTGTVTTETDPVGMCPGLGVPGGPSFPANLTNSPEAVAKARLEGGAAFLASYPSPSVELLVGSLYCGPGCVSIFWGVSFIGNPCTGPTGNQTEFGVVMGALGLGVISHGWANTTCGTATGTYYRASFGASTGSGHSGLGARYFDNISIASADGLTTAYLGLAVFEPNRTLINPASLNAPCFSPPYTGCDMLAGQRGWFAELRSGATIEGTYPGGPASDYWNTPGPVPLTGPLTLEIVSAVPLAGSGDTLEAFSWGATVTGSTTL